MGTAVHMISLEEIITILREEGMCHKSPSGILVPTHCLYPSNAPVVVEIAGATQFTVSDKGGAIDTIAAHGIQITSPARVLQPYAEKYGLRVSNDGKLFVGELTAGELYSAIVFVANASKEAALLTIGRHRQSQRERFKEEMSLRLKERYGVRYQRDVRILGASNKPHIFDGQIDLLDDRRVLLSTAIDDGNSINAVVVANIDVRARRDSRLIQRIVYDDSDDWRSESLLLLSQGAPTVAFKSLLPQIEGLARAA